MTQKDKIRQYILGNASMVVKSRAKTIEPQLDEIKNNKFTFSYKGSAIYPYEIIVKIDENIKTSCNCPYDHGGLCKHQVAALNYILQEKENSTKKKYKRPKKLYELFLPDHELPIGEFFSFSSFLLRRVFVDKVDLDKKIVWTSYDDMYTQKFTYNSDKKKLRVECSCKARSPKCEHISAAVMKIYDEFGQFLFAPDYEEKMISEYLSRYGMTTEDDYEKYFEFTFSRDGFLVEEKVKNLNTRDDLYRFNVFSSLDDQTKDRLILSAPPNNSSAKTHGIGFCFETSYDDELNFISIIGKYKKNTTELASSFTVVDGVQTLLDKVDTRSENEKIVLLEAVIISKQMEMRRYNSLASMKEIYVKIKEFVNKYKDKYPFFIKERRETLIRKNLTPLKFSDQTCELFFTTDENDDFISITPKIRIQKSYKIYSKLITITPLFCIKDKNTVHFFKSPKDFLCLSKLENKDTSNFLKKDKKSIIKNFIAPLSEHFIIENNICEIENFKENDNIKRQVFLADYEGEYITFKLGVEYDGKLVLTHTNEQIIEGDKVIKRNENIEDKFIEEFKELHPDFKEQSGIFYLLPNQLIQDEWLLKASQKLKHKNIEVFGAKDLKSFKYNLNQPSISMSINSNTDWFDLDIQVKFGKEKVSLKDVRKAILNKSKYVQLKDGTLGVLPEKWINKFSKYFKAGEVKDKAIKISNYQFNIIDELYEDLKKKPTFLMELQKKKESLKNLQNISPVKVPRTVKAKLRPYQQEGLNWLVCLQKNELGGCLADDMGLGKTLQAIALLAYIKQQKISKLPSLIVAPTSLIFNWNKEFEKFAPTMKLLTYTGVKREAIFKDIKKQDVVITTYGTVLNDVVKLQEQDFNYVILDESQAIKNPNSKRYKSVKLLKAQNRLTLTGTPIENNTFDLYSQMNFLNPGLLGSMSHFKSEFSDAIDKSHSKEASDLLAQIIYPFLLRRTKNQVATDLPQKTESIIYCEMGYEQRKIYEAFKDKYREFLLNKFEENGEAKSQMYVLEGLTKLRQICNSPQLLNEEEEYSNASIKLDMLIDNVKTITSEGSKILVFSQFTSMLALVQERLLDENIVFEYLDGQTRNREEKVKNFQENDDVSVFLISLKAGGTGLNLTKAEYVFLIDPWWNPAVENQAIDRCYRIGQTKNVIAYRMICKDTIEEKIVSLQENKKDVSDSIIQIDKETKSFDKAKVSELFG